nr:ubiquitin-protein ligase E3C-like [Rhipicephalus microplus]
MYSFEGEYRKRPQQSLGGASKKVGLDDLLRKSALRRQNREESRRQEEAALKIKAYGRGFLSRRRLARELRQKFDTTSRVSSDLGPLLSSIPLFYDVQVDTERLAWLSHQVLLRKDEVAGQADDPVWRLRIRRLLALNVVSLQRPGFPTATALRLLEVLGSIEAYPPLLPGLPVGGGASCPAAFMVAASVVPSGTPVQPVFYAVELFDCSSGTQLRFGATCSEMAAFSPSAFYGGNSEAFSESEDDFSDEDNYVAPSNIEESDSTEASEEKNEDGRDGGNNQNNTGPRETDWTAYLDNLPDFDPLPFTVPNPGSQVVTPQAQAMVDLLLLPLVKPVADGPECKDYQREIITCLLRGVLGDCPQVVRVVLPELATRWPYPGEPLLRAVLSLEPSPWLFQALLRLSSPAEPLFIAAAAHLSPCLTHKTEKSSYEDLDADELSPVDEIWSGDGYSSSSSLADEALEDFLEAALSSRENLPALCQLGWALLQRRPLALHHFRLLYTLAFRPQFLRQLWEALKDVRVPSLFVPGGTSVMQLLSSGICPPDNWAEPFSSQLNLFCSLLAHLLLTLHDIEFYESPAGDPMPFSLDELVLLIAQLRELCLGLLELCFPDTRTSLTPQQLKYLKTLWRPMFECVVSLLRQLYSRDSRRPFCPDGHWVSPRSAVLPERVANWNLEIQRLPTCGAAGLTRKQLEESGPPLTTSELRGAAILQEMPFAVPFLSQAKILQSLIARDKSENHRQSDFMLGPQIEVIVRRNYIYEDAFKKLSGEPNLRLRLRVQLVNVAGLEEAGIDGGGLLREFLAELMKTAFDENRGLFRCTHDDRHLYPNPAVAELPDYADGRAKRHYAFVGRLLGKALYEGMLVELPLAHFFLAKLVVPGRGDLDLHHLASLEPLVYRNLFFLKTYEGDVTDLGLDFTVMRCQLGNSIVEELKPNGTAITVTSANRIEYMHLLADHLLNAQLRQQCLAFRQGLEELLPSHWLRLFAPHELQVLVSGAESPIDLIDLREHTHYEGGYNPMHPVVKAFWHVVEDFDERQRRLLLKFVTSCSRPPLLGFKDLVPQFCIHSAGSEPGRLPTASTCMNLLKLPEIADEAQLREKLLYAIESGAGFELS